jgi:hypothetical protein
MALFVNPGVYVVESDFSPYVWPAKATDTLHKKYPALKTAWEHYEIILRMCQSQEEAEKEEKA